MIISLFHVLCFEEKKKCKIECKENYLQIKKTKIINNCLSWKLNMQQTYMFIQDYMNVCVYAPVYDLKWKKRDYKYNWVKVTTASFEMSKLGVIYFKIGVI